MASAKVNQNVFKTYNPEHLHSFKWVIENFSKIKYNSVLRSPKFKTLEDTVWHVTLEKITSNPDKIVLCFYNTETDGTSLEITVDLCDRNEEKLLSPTISPFNRENAMAFTFAHELQIRAGYYEKLNLPDDVLVLLCEMKYRKDAQLTESCNSLISPAPLTLGLECLSSNLKRIYEDSVSTDVTFKIKGSTILAHKTILIARSTVFEKMFQTGMTESVTNVVEVDDIELNVFKLFLEYLYTGVAPDTDFSTAQALIYVADKYSVLELKQIIFSLQSSKVTVDNAVSLLALADLHDDVNAKETASSFIKSYLEDVPNIEAVLKIFDDALSDAHGAELFKTLFSRNMGKDGT